MMVFIIPSYGFFFKSRDFMSQMKGTDCYYIQDVLRKGVVQTNTENNNRKVEELYEFYEQPMYRIAYAILHHVQQAEDAVHDAFVAIMRSNADIGDPRSPETKQFVIQTVRNTAINRYRKNSRETMIFTELDDTASQIPDKVNSVEERMKQMEQREIAEELMKGLSESERQVLSLRCEEELSFREIAEILGISESAVRKRFERARKAAQKQEGVLRYGKEIFTV